MSDEDKNLESEKDAEAEALDTEVEKLVKNSDKRVFDVKTHEVLPKMYLAYSLSVIRDRSLPDIRDGVKPVVRRVLFGMNDMGVTHTKPTRKSARIVGDVLGKYHPHGDGSVYGAAVRLAQDFTTRYPLIIGQGNFGSVEDNPAAMRYTEMKLAAIAEEVVADINKEVVDFMPNFDGTLQEPKVLPTKIPLFLVNGSVGIAVGMATSAPPHNLTEVMNALLAYIDNEDITVSELMNHIKGPDFPSGAMMFADDIAQIYETGRGSVTLRAKAVIEDKGKRQSIIITELPYQLNKSNLLTKIAQLYQEKEYEGIEAIADIRDESDRNGTRLVIDLRKGAQPKVVLNTLYRRTELQSKFSVFMRALINNEPRMVNLKTIFKHFVEHRKEIIMRRAEYDLKQAEAKIHILEGFLIVFNNLDEIIEAVKTSTSTKQTYDRLKKFKLSDIQIKAILELRIQRIAQFERETIVNEHKELGEKIASLQKLLNSEELILDVMKKECIEIKDKYGDARRTQIIQISDKDGNSIPKLEEIQEEDVIITVTKNGLVKRTPISEYRVQNIKGQGLIGVDVKDEDYVANVFQLSTHDFTLVFTDKGLCYRMNVHEIPSLGRTAAGSSILNILNLKEGERVVAVIPVQGEVENKMFLFASQKGQVKKLKAEKLKRPRADGTMAMGLDDDDKLIDAKIFDIDVNVLLVTKKGQSIRFSSSAIRPTGRSGSGVRGIKLDEGDSLLSLNVVTNEKASLITITKNGYAKRTELERFREQHRSGQGVICMNVSALTGDIVSANIIQDNNEQLIIVTSQGMLIRVKVERIRELGRHTQGSKIQKLRSSDYIASVAYLGIVKDEDIQDIEEEKFGEENQ